MEKTKVLTEGQDCVVPHTKVEINKNTMEIVRSFKRLGKCSSKDGGTQEGVKLTVSARLKTFLAINNLNFRSVNSFVKRVLYEKVIVSTVIYESEMRCMRMVHTHKVDVIEVKCSRSVCKITNLGSFSTEEVRRRVGVRRKMSEIVDQNSLSWFVYEGRLSGERLDKTLHESEVEGKRERQASYEGTRRRQKGEHCVVAGAERHEGDVRG